MLQSQLAMVAREDDDSLVRQARLSECGHDVPDDGIRFRAHREIDAADPLDGFLVKSLSPRLGFLLVVLGWMLALIQGRRINKFFWDVVQPELIRPERGVDQVGIQRNEERPIAGSARTDELNRPTSALPVGCVILALISRVDAVFLCKICIHDRVACGVQRLQEIGHAVHDRMPPGKVVHVLFPEQQHVVALAESTVIRPHALFQTLEVAPGFAFVGVSPGEHVCP